VIHVFWKKFTYKEAAAERALNIEFSWQLNRDMSARAITRQRIIEQIQESEA